MSWRRELEANALATRLYSRANVLQAAIFHTHFMLAGQGVWYYHPRPWV